MIKLVDILDIAMDWSDHALWWPGKNNKGNQHLHILFYTDSLPHLIKTFFKDDISLPASHHGRASKDERSSDFYPFSFEFMCKGCTDELEF